MKSNKVTGWVGTLLLHAAILLLLWWIGVARPQAQEEGGVPVMLGDTELAQGQSAPYKMTEVDILKEIAAVEAQEQLVEHKPKAQQGEEIITQQEEETVAITPKKEQPKKEQPKKEVSKKVTPVKETPKKTQPSPEVIKPKEQTEAEKRADTQRLAEEKRIAAEKAAAEQAAKNIAGAFGKGTQMSNGTSGTATTGNQGSTTGTASQGSATGTSGTGVWDLAGRSLGSGGLPMPVYNVQEEARVVVTITVNPSGQVIATSINKRTNTGVEALRKAAEDAARKARFNQVEGVNNQTGTITYYFRLK